MVIAPVAAAKSRAADGIRCGDASKNGQPGSHTEELIARLFGQDRGGNIEVCPSRGQAHTRFLLATLRCSEGFGHENYTVRFVRASSPTIELPARSIASSSMSSIRVVLCLLSIHSARERSTTWS